MFTLYVVLSGDGWVEIHERLSELGLYLSFNPRPILSKRFILWLIPNLWRIHPPTTSRRHRRSKSQGITRTSRQRQTRVEKEAHVGC
jgi:hypothetical protein